MVEYEQKSILVFTQCTLFQAKKMLQGHHRYSSVAQLALPSVEDYYQADVPIGEASNDHEDMHTELLSHCSI